MSYAENSCCSSYMARRATVVYGEKSCCSLFYSSSMARRAAVTLLWREELLKLFYAEKNCYSSSMAGRAAATAPCTEQCCSSSMERFQMVNTNEYSLENMVSKKICYCSSMDGRKQQLFYRQQRVHSSSMDTKTSAALLWVEELLLWSEELQQLFYG